MWQICDSDLRVIRWEVYFDLLAEEILPTSETAPDLASSPSLRYLRVGSDINDTEGKGL